MQVSEESKVDERVPLKAPVRPVKDRRIMRWDAKGLHTGNHKYVFDDLRFSLAMPNFNTLLDGLKICLPLAFEFRDMNLQKMSPLNVAPKDWCNNILERLSLRINGQELVQFPEDGLHSRIVWDHSTEAKNRVSDSGSYLPLVKHDQARSDFRNEGFERRQREFRSKLTYNTATVDQNGDTVTDRFHNGPEYNHTLELIPDLVSWQAFSKKVMDKAISAGAYIFECDIICTFRKDIESLNADSDSKGKLLSTPEGNLTQHSAIWREAFQIGNPMVSQYVDLNDDQLRGEVLPYTKTCLLSGDNYVLYGSTAAHAQGAHNTTRAVGGPNNLQGWGNAVDEQHTVVRWTAEVGWTRASFKPGDIVVISDEHGEFPNSRHALSEKNVSWFHIISAEVLADDGGENISVALTHAATRDGDPYAIGRRVRVFPALVIADWEQCRRWKIGDMVRFNDPVSWQSHKLDAKIFGFNDGNSRLLMDRPVVDTTFDGGPPITPGNMTNFMSAHTEITNVYAEQGGMSIPLGSTDAIGGVVGDYNNPAGRVSSGQGAAGVARSTSARTFLRLDYLPKHMVLKDGDIIRIRCVDLPVRYNGQVAHKYEGQFRVVTNAEGDVGTYVRRTRHDDGDNQTLAEMRVCESTNTAVVYLTNAQGVALYDAIDAYLGIPELPQRDAQGDIVTQDDGHGQQVPVPAPWNGDIVFSTLNQLTQVSHVGGKVEIFHSTEHEIARPVKYITARYTKQPYVEAEAIQMDPNFIKQSYSYPYMESEIYKQRVSFDWDAGTKKIIVRMPQITLLQGFSTLFLYAPLHPDHRRLEFYTGFSDMYFKISGLTVRVNEKYCVRGSEPESWFYDEFQKVTEKKITIDQWRDRQIIALTPESLGHPALFESAKRLYNLGIEFTCELSPPMITLMENAKDLYSTLSTTSHLHNQWSKHNLTATDYIKKLNAQARVVVEYRRKKVTLDQEGEVRIDQAHIATPQPDGLSLRGKVQQTYMRSGGNPTGFHSTF